jgi:hypothetical protein
VSLKAISAGMMLAVVLGVQLPATARPDAPPTTWSAEDQLRLVYERRAATDVRLASEWLAQAYEIPERVPQEMLLAGYDYADVLVALAMMGKGASLNEILQLRETMQWTDVARKVELDPQALPAPIQPLLALGSPGISPAPLHFLPDVYPGLTHDLTLPAFSPTEPGDSVRERYRLSDTETRNIRAALADPLGVPEKLLLQSGGRGGLLVGDWVLSGVLAHFKPFSMDTIIAARVGEQLSWSELCLAYGLRPDVLTQGPLAGIYPVMSGHPATTVLCARKRHDFPDVVPTYQNLQRIAEPERQALSLLMQRCYRLTPEEMELLQAQVPDLSDRAIAVKVARLGRMPLVEALSRHESGTAWTVIITENRIDMTGQEALLAAIVNRESPMPMPQSANLKGSVVKR